MPLWLLRTQQNKFSGWRTAILLRSAFQIRIPGSRCCSRMNQPTQTISIPSIIGCGWKFGRPLRQRKQQHSQSVQSYDFKLDLRVSKLGTRKLYLRVHKLHSRKLFSDLCWGDAMRRPLFLSRSTHGVDPTITCCNSTPAVSLVQDRAPEPLFHAAC